MLNQPKPPSLESSSSPLCSRRPHLRIGAACCVSPRGCDRTTSHHRRTGSLTPSSAKRLELRTISAAAFCARRIRRVLGMQICVIGNCSLFRIIKQHHSPLLLQLRSAVCSTKTSRARPADTSTQTTTFGCNKVLSLSVPDGACKPVFFCFGSARWAKLAKCFEGVLAFSTFTDGGQMQAAAGCIF